MASNSSSLTNLSTSSMVNQLLPSKLNLILYLYHCNKLYLLLMVMLHQSNPLLTMIEVHSTLSRSTHLLVTSAIHSYLVFIHLFTSKQLVLLDC
jgi:hypothetical protein